MDITDIKLGLVLDGHVYVPVPMQPACRGCDLLKRCDGGEQYLCEFVDKWTGTKNMLKELQGMDAEKVAKAKATLAKAYERAMADDDCDIYDPSYRCLSMVLDAVVRAIDLLDKASEGDK